MVQGIVMGASQTFSCHNKLEMLDCFKTHDSSINIYAENGLSGYDYKLLLGDEQSNET